MTLNDANFTKLQWGRDLAIAEIADLEQKIAGITGLQWGRDLAIAEIGIHVNGRPVI